jgi:hypothetical protein
MKKMLKHIGVAAFVLATVLFVNSASAQQAIYAPVTIAATPTTIASTITTNFATPPVIDCRKQQNVAMCLSFNQGSGSVSNVTYTFQKSVDGIYFDTSNPITITLASTGTTRLDWVTNINVAGVAYLRLYSIANTTSLVSMTNYGIVYGIKIGAP